MSFDFAQDGEPVEPFRASKFEIRILPEQDFPFKHYILIREEGLMDKAELKTALNLGKVAQIGCVVRDLSKTIKRYEETIGIGPFSPSF